jgi:phospholipid-transporting ATPase
VQVNHSLILVYREGKFVSVKWEFVRVGEIVKVLRNSNLPADLLFVWSANEGGVCHVETMNLDGETNLKIKESLGLADTEEQALSMAGELVCDPPNNAIYSFSGNVQLKTGELYPVEDRNILLRGSSLRNTEAVLGVVVYTGHNTKVSERGMQWNAPHRPPCSCSGVLRMQSTPLSV